jgi:hypothetical protein
MSRKKKSKIDDYVMTSMPAEDAARHAVHNHPEVCALETAIRKAIASTIRRVISHRPLVKRQTRRKR